MSQVSAQVDREFLSSYRVHMMSIQAEIKKLKNDVTKGEQLLNSDAQVAKLENEAKWFSDECDRLSSHHNSMTRDCDVSLFSIYSCLFIVFIYDIYAIVNSK